MVRTYTLKPTTSRSCQCCGRAFMAKRTDARFCDVACRHRSSRYGVASQIAHQHRLKVRQEPDNPPDTFAGCTFGEIDRTVAVPILSAYEWLGDAGSAHRFFAAFAPDGRVMAACGFVERFHRHDDGSTVLLARGCTTPAAHRHAASWLLGRAFKVLRGEGVTRVIAYSDLLAGERGVVYSAVGMTPAGSPKDRWRVRPPGVKWHDHAACLSDRWLRHGGRNWSFEEARLRGFRVERVVGRQRWERRLGS